MCVCVCWGGKGKLKSVQKVVWRGPGNQQPTSSTSTGRESAVRRSLTEAVGPQRRETINRPTRLQIRWQGMLHQVAGDSIHTLCGTDIIIEYIS